MVRHRSGELGNGWKWRNYVWYNWQHCGIYPDTVSRSSITIFCIDCSDRDVEIRIPTNHLRGSKKKAQADRWDASVA